MRSIRPLMGRGITVPSSFHGLALHCGPLTDELSRNRHVVPLSALQSRAYAKLDRLKSAKKYSTLLVELRKNIQQKDDSTLPLEIIEDIYSDLVLVGISQRKEAITFEALIWLYRYGSSERKTISRDYLVTLLYDTGKMEALSEEAKRLFVGYARENSEPGTIEERFIRITILRIVSPEENLALQARMIEELWDVLPQAAIAERMRCAILYSELANDAWFAFPEAVDCQRLLETQAFLVIHDQELRDGTELKPFHCEMFRRLCVFDCFYLTQTLLEVWGSPAPLPFRTFHAAMRDANLPFARLVEAVRVMNQLQLEALVKTDFFPDELQSEIKRLIVRIHGQVVQETYLADKASAEQVASFLPADRILRQPLAFFPNLGRMLDKGRRASLEELEPFFCQRDDPLFIRCLLAEIIPGIEGRAYLFYFLGEDQVEQYLEMQTTPGDPTTYVRVCYKIVRDGEKRRIDPRPIFDEEQLAGNPPPAWLHVYSYMALRASLYGLEHQNAASYLAGISGEMLPIRREIDRARSRLETPRRQFETPLPPKGKNPLSLLHDSSRFQALLNYHALSADLGIGEVHAARQGALFDVATTYREFLGDFGSLRQGITGEEDLIFTLRVETLLHNSDLRRVSLSAVENNIMLRFYVGAEGRYFEAPMRPGFEFDLPGFSGGDHWAMRCFLVAAVYEGIMNRVDSGLVGEVEGALDATPKPKPIVVRREPKESRAQYPVVVRAGRVKPLPPPPPAPMPAPVSLPVLPPPDPALVKEEAFFERARGHLRALRRLVVEREIDLAATGDGVVADAIELAHFLAHYRDNELIKSRRVSFKESGDSLEGTFSEVAVFTPAEAVTRLAGRGLRSETIAALNLDGQNRILICFRNNAPPTRIYGIIDLGRGEIELLGAQDGIVGEDLKNRLLRIGLECYGVCTSQTILLLRRLLGISAGQARQALIDQWLEGRNGKPNLSPGVRAIAICDPEAIGFIRDVVEDRHPQYGQLLPRLARRARDLLMAERGLPKDEPIFTRRLGQYIRVAEDKRCLVIAKTPFEQIFLLDQRAIVVRLPLMQRKVDEGERALLPKMPDSTKVAAAREMGLNIAPQVGIFAVVEYGDEKNAVVVRLALEDAENLPEVKIRRPDYPDRKTAEGIQLEVYPGMPEEIVDALLQAPEVQKLITEWTARLAVGKIPDERQRLGTNGRAQALAGLTPTACRLLVMPIPRTFEEPKFSPLSSLSLAAQQKIIRQNVV